AVVPVAAVVAGSGVLIEVAVGLARSVVAAGNSERERSALGVVAGAEAIGIIGVEAPIAVVVRAVATSIDLALAGRVVADASAAVRGDDHAGIEVDAVQIDRIPEEPSVVGASVIRADHLFAAAAAQQEERAGHAQHEQNTTCRYLLHVNRAEQKGGP